MVLGILLGEQVRGGLLLLGVCGGTMKLSMGYFEFFALDPIHIELLAILQGLRKATSVSKSVVIWSDFKPAVQAILNLVGLNVFIKLL